MNQIALQRIDLTLRHALGDEIASILSDDKTTDLMLDASGELWIDRLGEGRSFTGLTMSSHNALTAMKIIADHCGCELTKHSPILSGTIPRTGERIAGTIPPITDRPTFAIRRPPQKIFSLEAFIRAGDNISSEKIRRALEEHRNVLVAGGTGSGKTSLLSSLLSQKVIEKDRLCVLEDTHEIMISAQDHVRMLTSADVDMEMLVKQCLRYRPDRIIIGEIRDAETAIEMIAALNTGHGGSLSSVHANSAKLALQRIESWFGKSWRTVPVHEIANAIGCVVSVQKDKVTQIRYVTDVIYVDGWADGQYIVS